MDVRSRLNICYGHFSPLIPCNRKAAAVALSLLSTDGDLPGLFSLPDRVKSGRSNVRSIRDWFSPDDPMSKAMRGAHYGARIQKVQIT